MRFSYHFHVPISETIYELCQAVALPHWPKSFLLATVSAGFHTSLPVLCMVCRISGLAPLQLQFILLGVA